MSIHIFLSIIVTSLATYSSRFLGVVSSVKVKETSKIFSWFNCIAYATLAALLGRMIIFPAGVLAQSDLITRLLVFTVCIIIYKITKENLVIPTLFSFIFLSTLSYFI